MAQPLGRPRPAHHRALRAVRCGAVCAGKAPPSMKLSGCREALPPPPRACLHAPACTRAQRRCPALQRDAAHAERPPATCACTPAAPPSERCERMPAPPLCTPLHAELHSGAGQGASASGSGQTCQAAVAQRGPRRQGRADGFRRAPASAPAPHASRTSRAARPRHACPCLAARRPFACPLDLPAGSQPPVVAGALC